MLFFLSFCNGKIKNRFEGQLQKGFLHVRTVRLHQVPSISLCSKYELGSFDRNFDLNFDRNFDCNFDCNFDHSFDHNFEQNFDHNLDRK